MNNVMHVLMVKLNGFYGYILIGLCYGCVALWP